ncbi:MAG: MBL fold metallo-hydrolase [Dehalococcoidia bacterium]|nr:MBL fold metallo-hydrolase [Dehalococcoidia bacterium]
MTEILPGIHRVDGVRFANSYLVIGDDSIVVIDTGIPGSAGKIVRYIKQLGRYPDDVEYIVLTHADIDHIGSASKLREITGAKVAIYREDAPCAAGEAPIRKDGLKWSLSKARIKLFKFGLVKADVFLKDGDEVGGFRVIHTPGHTRGSICLYRSPDVVFVGDTVRVDHGGNPRYSAKKYTLNLEQVYNSVKMISELKFDVLLAGHGTPLSQDAGARLKRLL